MEVHHHPNVEKKNFKEYFLEFLMIFLAVTMGFFAETIREKISENNQADELAKSLYQEAYSDSVNVQKVIAQRLKKEQSLVYVRKVISDSNMINPPKQFYTALTYGFFLTTNVTFEPADGVLNQLRNSGTLRYFRNMQVQNKIGELSVDIAKLRDREQQEYNFASSYLRPFVLQHFDFRLLDSVVREGELSMAEVLKQDSAQLSASVKLINYSEVNKKESENLAYYYAIMMRSSRQSQFAQYIKVNHELLELLRNEYSVAK